MNHNAAVASSLLLLVGACNASRTGPTSTAAPEARAPAPSSAPATIEQPAATAPAAATGPASAAARTRTFDDDAVNAAPAGFSFGRTGSGAQGRWVVRAEADAPSRPNVLAQLDADDTDVRFPVAVADAPSLRDLRLSVRCKSVSGRVDQACGLVFRYLDENNYFITRSNPLENNIRLYTVKDGRRRQLASWSGTVTAGAWHEYVVEARSDHIQVFWDGTKVLDHRDSTFMEAGRAGVWTKADSVTYFDDLRVEPLQ